MADISFNEEQSVAGASMAPKKPFLIRLMLSTKLVSTDRQAEYALIGIAVICVLLAVLLWPKGRPQANPAEVPPVAGPLDTRTVR